MTTSTDQFDDVDESLSTILNAHVRGTIPTPEQIFRKALRSAAEAAALSMRERAMSVASERLDLDDWPRHLQTANDISVAIGEIPLIEPKTGG